MPTLRLFTVPPQIVSNTTVEPRALLLFPIRGHMGIVKPRKLEASGPSIKGEAPLHKRRHCVDITSGSIPHERKAEEFDEAWTDEDGFSCLWYASDGTSTRCSLFGHTGAQSACCVCGGGNSTGAAAKPSVDSSLALTTAAADNSVPSLKAFTGSESDWSKLFGDVSKATQSMGTVADAVAKPLIEAAKAADKVSKVGETLASLGDALKGFSAALGAAGAVISIVTLFLPAAPSEELVFMEEAFAALDIRLDEIADIMTAGFMRLEDVIVSGEVDRQMGFLDTVETRYRFYTENPNKPNQDSLHVACNAPGQSPIDVMMFLFRHTCSDQFCTQIPGITPLMGSSFSALRLAMADNHLQLWFEGAALPMLMAMSRAMMLQQNCAAILYERSLPDGVVLDESNLDDFNSAFTAQVVWMDTLMDTMVQSVSAQYDQMKQCWPRDLLIAEDLEGNFKANPTPPVSLPWAKANELRDNLKLKYSWLDFNVAVWDEVVSQGQWTAPKADSNSDQCNGERVHSAVHQWQDKNVLVQWWPRAEDEDWADQLPRHLPNFGADAGPWCASEKPPLQRNPAFCKKWEDAGSNTCLKSYNAELFIGHDWLDPKWGFVALRDADDQAVASPHCYFSGDMGPKKKKNTLNKGVRYALTLNCPSIWKPDRVHTSIMVSCDYLM